MAAVPITAISTKRKSTRFIRDCENPSAPPVEKEGRDIHVLQVAAECPSPDEVIVNGLRYVPEVQS